MDISDRLKQAWADVETAGLPEHVQGLALVEALRLRTNGAAPATETGNEGSGGSSEARGTTSNSSTPSDDSVDDAAFFAAIERETGVEVEVLESVIYLKDNVPHVNVPKRMLGDSLKLCQINVATLIVVARHFGLGEAEVPDAAVRNECQRLTIFDRNFAKNLRGIPGLIQTGDRTKVFKVRGAGVKSFVESITSVTGQRAAE